MTRSTSANIRRTTICFATALAVSLPSIAEAGLLDRAKSRAQTAKSKATTTLSIVRQKRPVATAIQNVRNNRPIANAVQNATGNLPDPAELFEMVQELHLMEQLRNLFASTPGRVLCSLRGKSR